MMLRALLLLLLAGCHPLLAQDVYRNPANESGTTLPGHIDFAIWSISTRTGLDMNYVGTTTQHCVPGAITFRSYTLVEWVQEGLPNKSAVTGQCTGGGSVIVINPLYAPASRGIVLHELGHAAGYASHSPDPQDVMHAAVGVDHLLTTTDALNIRAGTPWLLPAAASLCHVEMGPDKDFIIPELAGKRALMDYVGVVGGYQTWTRRYSNVNPSAQGCTGNTQFPSGDVILTDIRSMGANYSGATLQSMGNDTWRLTSLTP